MERFTLYIYIEREIKEKPNHNKQHIIPDKKNCPCYHIKKYITANTCVKADLTYKPIPKLDLRLETPNCNKVTFSKLKIMKKKKKKFKQNL